MRRLSSCSDFRMIGCMQEQIHIEHLDVMLNDSFQIHVVDCIAFKFSGVSLNEVDVILDPDKVWHRGSHRILSPRFMQWYCSCGGAIAFPDIGCLSEECGKEERPVH